MSQEQKTRLWFSIRREFRTFSFEKYLRLYQARKELTWYKGSNQLPKELKLWQRVYRSLARKLAGESRHTTDD